MVVSYVTKPLVKETPVTEPRAKAVYFEIFFETLKYGLFVWGHELLVCSHK